MQDNPDKQQRISILFEKYLRGECTRQEAEEILAVLENAENDPFIKSRAALLWNDFPDIKSDKDYLGSKLNDLHHRRNLIDRQKSSVRFSDKKWLHYTIRAAAILFIPLFIYSLYLTTRISDNNYAEVKSAIWHTLKVPAGVQSEFILPDGSQVWLNSCSVFKYPDSFSGEKRQVELIGEAYFDIIKDPVHPFIINASDLTIEVKGTQFVVVNYPDNPEIEVILESGDVMVSIVDGKGNKTISLTRKGEMAIYESTGNTISVEKVSIDKYTSWKDGILIFRDDPISVVARKLSRKFNVDIELQGIDVEDYVYTATFRYESLTQILELLKRSAPIKYTRTEQKLLKDNSYIKPKIIITAIN
ncbi:MAG TPA: hypothetical protein DDW27_10650 [Bacteroidales bacterium]|nr:hypothetical protein [Bacteroidales bacterium]